MKAIFNQSFFLGNAKGLLALLLLVVLLPLVFVAGQTAIRLFPRAAAVPANIVVDVTKSSGVLPRPWEGLSQGGEQSEPGKLVNLSPVIGQIKTLGVRYIRLDHILEEPFWDSRRQRVQEILDAGAIPFISLSYFPKSVADSNIGTVSDWNEWQNRVRTLVSEVSGRDQMNVSGIYFEVWNEPDGPGFGSFNIGSGKDYYVLYKKTVEAALSAPNTNSFKIGGPALADLRRCTNGLLFVCQNFWLDKFLGLVSGDRTRLDFISWHRYSLRLSDYNEDVNFILKLYNKHANLPPAEKIITEWGSDPARSPIHNGVFDAAHLVAAARSFVGFVDLATKFEVRDGPDYPDSGWGVLYNNGAKKPAFEALTLLGLLRRDRVIISGEGTSVTGLASRDNSGITIILANYDRYSTGAETVPITINNLTPGTYRLTKHVIDNLHPHDAPGESTVNIPDGIYKTTQLMLPNSVFAFDFQRVSVAQ